jgi:hypothetical protein
MATALAQELRRLADKREDRPQGLPVGGGLGGQTGYAPADWSAQYANIYNALKQALDAAYEAQRGQYEAQLPEIKESYDAQRANVYANARLQALGNNEATAAMGLGGNAYQGPTSGYSESSRIADTNALRSAINAAGLQQRKAEEGVGRDIAQAGLSRDEQAAQMRAALEQAMVESMRSENQYAANYALQQAQYDEAVRQYNDKMESQRQQDAYAQAYRELQTYGRIVTPQAAAALGVSVGTRLRNIKRG